MDSDDDLRRHCLDDVAHPLTCQIVFIPSKRCVFLLSLPSVLVVPSVWLVKWRCHIVIVVEVVEQLREVAGSGGGRDEAEVVERKNVCLFTMCMRVFGKRRLRGAV